MALLKIARLGHPILLSAAAPVSFPLDRDTLRLVEDMIETMHDAGGVGLAAPQVHVPLRLFVYHVPAGRLPANDGGPTPEAIGDTIVANPSLEPCGGETDLDWEGCLSIPGLRGLVPRASSVLMRYADREGASATRSASGFEARILQHETDHLDGIVYLQRMDGLRSLGFIDELGRPGRSP